MASLSLKHIFKTYAGNAPAAVSDFSLEIEDKEFIILVGPSGCGKSTTLRMILLRHINIAIVTTDLSCLSNSGHVRSTAIKSLLLRRGKIKF